MKPRYSFSSRHTKRARDSENMKKQKEKYPDITKKIIQESDIILEVLDSRFIYETRNFEIEEIIKKQNKRIIYVLNKSDLINIKIENIKNLKPSIVISCKLRKGTRLLRNKIKEISKKIKKEKITVGVIGYPNTGKSSLINLLIGKSSAAISSQAGFTKSIQKLKLNREIVLIDTPGVIPKKDYSTVKGKLMAKSARIGGKSYSQIKDPELAVSEIIKLNRNILENFYGIDSEGNSEILIEKLGKIKNFLKKGNIVDEKRTACLILKDWQEGKIHLKKDNS